MAVVGAVLAVSTLPAASVLAVVVRVALGVVLADPLVVSAVVLAVGAGLLWGQYVVGRRAAVTSSPR